MKKSLTKIAAAAMAAMLAGSVSVTAVSAEQKQTQASVSKTASSETSSNSGKDETAMQDALTKVKKRVTVPKELTEFSYETDMQFGKKIFRFTWTTPEDAKEEYKSLSVSIVGSVITSYNSSGITANIKYGEPRLAKLSEEQLLEKAKGYVKQLNPDIYTKLKFELKNLHLTSGDAQVEFTRYENGVRVNGNGGSVRINKDTGELISLSAGWWEDAVFSGVKSAKTEKEIEELYRSLCKLTPMYKISSEWDEAAGKSKTVVRIVYTPDAPGEIDALTGTQSTIWDDMSDAKGEQYYYSDYGVMYSETEEALAADAAGMEDGGVNFTPAELKKIEQDKNLIKTDEAFEQLKKDKFAALTDDYKLGSYDIHSQKDENGKETFTLSLSYFYDKEKAKTADNYYSNIRVSMDAETGKVTHLDKYNLKSKNGLPKLDAAKANAAALETARTYGKDIISKYRAGENNSSPVRVWESERYNSSSGKTEIIEEYETSRQFSYNRYENNIRVYGDDIYVTVDSNGVVTNYSSNHTENVIFPDASILSVSEAFDKLYAQQKFDYYYDGWVEQNGRIHTYLLYNMKGFYLNAKTGAVCNFYGGKPYEYKSVRDVKYSDIKGIPQEAAIKALQKYGVGLGSDPRFNPAGAITEEELQNLLTNALGGYAVAYSDDVIEPDTPEAKAKAEADKKDKAETTREEAAVIFAKIYDTNGIAELKGIFRSVFADVKANDENAGYIAIAYAKGFIPMTSDRKFGGSVKVTRAEAVQMLYDYLKLISK